MIVPKIEFLYLGTLFILAYTVPKTEPFGTKRIPLK